MSFQQFRMVSLVADVKTAAIAARQAGVCLANTQLWVRKLHNSRG